MLSVCIPVYNFNLKPLVSSLHKQGKTLGVAFEILLADDDSDDHYKTVNQPLDSLEHVKYLQLDKNIGRAKIRNYLAEKAGYPYLLFMDCDSMTPDDDYLMRYISYCKGSIIVCGGRTHYPTPGNECFRLRWRYGTKREENPASLREKNPNNSFMTNNFLISKDLFKKFWLNEAITGYGHEDTYFGYQLKKNKVRVIHIDNPLIHVGLEPSQVYLAKTKEAINNLLHIYEISGYDPDLAEMVSLLNTFRKIKRWNLSFFMRFFYNMFNGLMQKNLLGSNPKLWILDLYKLAYICKIDSQ